VSGVSCWVLGGRGCDKLVSILRPNLHLETTDTSALDRQIARRLQSLRAGQGWTLEALAERTGISRATLSRIERGELSPTATMLSTLCGQYGWTISRLMAEAESSPAALVREKDQVIWKDPGSGYVRRVVSPPDSRLKGELVEVTLPPGAVADYETSPIAGLEHHLWMLGGVLDLEIEGAVFRLQKGDCVRYALNGRSRFACLGRRPVRYVIALVHP
jgi:transcriptional regulator with XRE-family HTH domain